jgi:hypothetical protein
MLDRKKNRVSAADGSQWDLVFFGGLTWVTSVVVEPPPVTDAGRHTFAARDTRLTNQVGDARRAHDLACVHAVLAPSRKGL